MVPFLKNIHRKARDLISIVRPNVPPIFFESTTPWDLLGRLNIDQPWIADGRLWATNRHIAVWTWLEFLNLSDRERKLYSAEGRNVPPLASIIQAYWHSPRLVELPSVPEKWVCPECEGSCWSVYDKSYLCYTCSGEGEVDNLAKIRIGASGIYLMAAYIGMLRRHGITKIRLPLDQEQWPVRFCAGKVEGILMGMDARQHSYTKDRSEEVSHVE